MNKITLKLNRAEWTELAGIVLRESMQSDLISDKYMRAVVHHLLKQVYMKLHNKLHSLREKGNGLCLTLPEAAVLSISLQDLDTESYLVITVTGQIDQKLT